MFSRFVAPLRSVNLTSIRAASTKAELGRLGSPSEAVFDRENKYGAHNYHPLPVALTKGEGTST